MPANPFDKVNQWLHEAVEGNALEPTAVIVATSTPDGHPSMRTVLLKEVLNDEFVFYSNYESRKGRQMSANPHVALTFLWHEMERQIHIEGTVRHLSAEESDAYFAQRPYKSRVGARVSPQSHPIPNREYIMVEPKVRWTQCTSPRQLGWIRGKAGAYRILARPRKPFAR